MKHIARFLILGTRKGDAFVRRRKNRTVDHLPQGRRYKGIVYKLVRPDQRPVTDEDWDTVHRCAACYPAKNAELTDNRKTS